MKIQTSTYCIGIDGCKDGWVAVYCPVLAFDQAQAKHYTELSQLRNDFIKPSIIIIDIPIGLETNEPNRSCDIEARKFLRNRSSTVFSPPCLEAIFSTDYNTAKEINLKRTGKSISKQSFFLSHKIRETKRFVEVEKQFDIREGHPECSFAEYQGKPLTNNKKGMLGILQRQAILNKLNFNLFKLAKMLPINCGVKIDDLFDATILCWTASRVFSGSSRTFPNSPSSVNSFCIHM